MQRCAFLATTAATPSVLTGCLSQSGTDDPAAPAIDSPGETDQPPETTASEPTATAEVSVDSVALQHGYAGPNSPDSIGIHSPDQQYLVAAVTVEGDHDRDAFGLELDDDSVAPSTPDRFYRTDWGDEAWYTSDQSMVDRVGRRTPEMTARFDMGETATPDGPPTVTVVVTNEGDHARRFLGALNRTGP